MVMMFRYNNKGRSMKERHDKLDFIKIKTFCSVKDNVNRKVKPHIARKYLQKTHPIKDYYLKYPRSP